MSEQTTGTLEPPTDRPVDRPADQLDGQAPAPASGAAPGPTSGPAAAGVDVADVEEALKDVVDPELGINVVDLGLVYGLSVAEPRTAVIDMTLTSAACPLTDEIEEQVAQVLDGLVDDHRINWVWMPPWDMSKITDDGREQLRTLGFNV